MFSLREERDNRFAKGLNNCREKHGVSMIFRLHSPLYSLTGYSRQVGQGVVYLSTLGSLCCTCGHPTTSLSRGSVGQGSATCAWADPDGALGPAQRGATAASPLRVSSGCPAVQEVGRRTRIWASVSPAVKKDLLRAGLFLGQEMEVFDFLRLSKFLSELLREGSETATGLLCL